MTRPDVVLVMVHVWEDDPSLIEIKWTEHARRCALGANQTALDQDSGSLIL
jgi:hypothetical protein